PCSYIPSPPPHTSPLSLHDALPISPFFQRDRARLDIVAKDLRHAPRQPDRHPRGHDAARGAGGHEQLALVAGEIACEREPAAALPEDLAHERQGRAREQAAAHADLVAVL